MKTHPRSPAKKPQLLVPLESAEAKADLIQQLREVLDAHGITADNWAVGIRLLHAFWWDHRQEGERVQGVA